MIVWGGQSGTLVRDSGGLYDPVADAWAPMATTEGRTENAAAWTGNELIVWGGSAWAGPWTDGGARYNPATDTWTPIATEGAPSPRAHPGRGGFTWSGEELLVWGGFGPTGEVGGGSRYHPGSDTWTPMSEVGAPSPRYGHVTVWSGDEMIVWGGAEYSPDIVLGNGARYNPATDNWTTMSTAGTPLPALYATGVWSGSELLLWGGACAASGQPTCHTDSYEGGRYDPVTDTWSPTSLDGVPEARRYHTAVWTGEALIVWGGIGTWSGYRHTGGAYFPYGSPAEEPICFVDGFEMGDTSAWSATGP
jgi:N-acetylneuraminic acid mutarotase